LLNDPERLKLDVIKEIYSFYPKTLLVQIGEVTDDIKFELLNLPKLIEQYATIMREQKHIFLKMLWQMALICFTM
jgi:predicted nucleotidyltransferase